MTTDLGDKFIQDLQKDAEQLVKAVQGLADDHASTSTLAYPDGISLLSLKSDGLLSYLHHLVLLVSHRLRGHSLAVSPGADLVKNLVHLRLVLEKARPLEARLKYQIEKLHRAVEDEDRERRSGRAPASAEDEDDQDVDLLSFRPNPSAMSTVNSRGGREAQAAAALSASDSEGDAGGVRVYRPPKAMPVVYDGDAPRRRRRGSPGGAEDEDESRASRIRGRSSALLADLSAGLSSNPFEASSSGVGVGGAGRSLTAASSAKARALRKLEDYEEDNYTRVFMGKKDSKRRRRDEEDVALGGAGQSGGRVNGRLGAGMEAEFGDLLRTHERGGAERSQGKRRRPDQDSDAYDALRKAGRKDRGGTLDRARRSGAGDAGDGAGFGEARGASGSAFGKAKKAFARKEKGKGRR